MYNVYVIHFCSSLSYVIEIHSNSYKAAHNIMTLSEGIHSDLNKWADFSFWWFPQANFLYYENCIKILFDLFPFDSVIIEFIYKHKHLAFV